jgi:DNA-binding winged helix-turn-helix (wHTH) protein
MPDLTFEVLGPLRARRGGAELDLGSPQQKAVLAVLLLARGRHVSLETLIDGLWGERAPRTASSTIRNYVSRLRGRLHPDPSWPDQDVIKLVGDGYTLRLGSAVLDVDVFERLAMQARRVIQPSVAVPAMLPAAPADFTGRAYDLSTITAALTYPAAPSPTVAICGMPGIGKTALAIQAALSVIHEFPDGQLFADLSDPDDTAASPASVLTGFLSALGVNAGPERPFERAAAWRAALRGRKMIIVLDDMRDPAQVRPLLPPPPGCAVVITSRRSSLELPDVGRFEISRLRLEESVRLLARLIGAQRVAAEPAAAERLVEVCGRQPLPIHTVGARLAVRPTWRIAAMERQVGDELAGLMTIRVDCEVAAPFESAYSRLTPEQALVFRQASITEGAQISVAATSVALGVPEHATRAVLAALADLHLLEADGVSGEFRYDPLIKFYARRKASDLDGLRAASPISA